MIIEESDLKELLQKQKKSVESKHFPIEAIFSLAAFVLSALMAQIFTQKLWLKTVFWIFVACNIIYVLKLLINYKKSKYSESDFLKDIKNSAQVRNFSLLAIKDKSGNFKDKYLLRYDRRWKCWLLPYRETHAENDRDFISEYLEKVLSLKDFSILETKTDDITKFSVSDQITKNYHHTFYHVEFDASELGGKKTIKLNGEKFRWFTIDEMKRNKAIESKNSETVRFIARNFMIF